MKQSKPPGSPRARRSNVWMEVKVDVDVKRGPSGRKVVARFDVAGDTALRVVPLPDEEPEK